MIDMAARVRHFGTTIFAEMTALANRHGAINLGQGFPDFPAPDFAKEAAVTAIAGDINQYAPANGRARLRAAVSAKMERTYNLLFDPDREVLVTHGATEAIFATIMGLVNPGDEVVLFEPYYDSYVPAVTMAGGLPRFYTLRPPTWRLDPDELAQLFNPRTRLIIVNTPHNPTGKLFTLRELEEIGALCQHHDVIAVTDEVYEHITFDGTEHVCLASLPGMRERTVTISSLGKTFSATGWKVGWVLAQPNLIAGIFRVHQFVTFCGVAPMQEAAAVALEEAQQRGYYAALASSYQEKRDFLLAALEGAGLSPLPPTGTYFVMVDISRLPFADDVAFCRFLTEQVGVAAIPPSAFYHNPADGGDLVRFAFCKSEATLLEASRRLAALSDYI